MARPLKQGLDYFPLDVDIDQDDKIQLVEAKHGPIAFVIIIKLLAKIYKECYFYKWGEQEQLLFSKKINVDINLTKNVVNECINYALFDKNMFETYNILTSKGIQKRYFEATKRRKDIFIEEQFLILNEISVVKSNNDHINVSNILVNDDISTQSIVKKRKVKKIKVRYAEFVSLSANEYEELVKAHGENKTKKFIELLDNYKGSSGKVYECDYRAILSWVIKSVNEASLKSPLSQLTPYKPAVVDFTEGEE